MSNAVAESSQSKSSPSGKKRSNRSAVWLTLLVVAAVVFGATVVWAGGINEVLTLVGLGSSGTESPATSNKGTGAGGAPPSSATTSTATTATAQKLPSSAGDAMYREQLQSQDNIAELVNNKIASFTLGTPEVGASSAVVPVTVTFRNGSSGTGQMRFKKYNDLWYFFSITAAGGGGATPDSAIDESVVAVITKQQATPSNQDAIENGILGGGYKDVKVIGVSKGSGTATVGVTLSGGSDPSENGEFLCISKKDGSTQYWFLTRFAAE